MSSLSKATTKKTAQHKETILYECLNPSGNELPLTRKQFYKNLRKPIENRFIIGKDIYKNFVDNCHTKAANSILNLTLVLFKTTK